MPKFLIYRGERKNIGRFGMVETDTPLVLTEREYEGVKDDPDFQPNKSGRVPEGDDQVGRENAHKRIMLLEIREQTKEKLLVIVDELVRDGYEITLSPHPNWNELVRVVEEAIERGPTNVAEEIEAPDTSVEVPATAEAPKAKAKAPKGKA
jgi:hypothetical protein